MTTSNSEQPTPEGVLANLRERATHMCRPEEFMRKPAVFEMTEEPTGERRYGTMDKNEEYELTLTIGVRYWCNQAQRTDARRNAEAVLAHTLYRDVLGDLMAIQHAIYDGDQRAALQRVATLRERLTK